MDGSYFSPFNTTKEKNLYQDRGDRENNKIVCWYEGLCYEYVWPDVKKFVSEEENTIFCNQMTKIGSWNVSPYAVWEVLFYFCLLILIYEK